MHQPPIQTAALAPVGGAIGPEPEHFIVDEVPLYNPVGEGEHWYVRMRKRKRTTPELLRAVGQAARVKERDIGYAGLKDKHAVTSQWLSLPRAAEPPQNWQLSPDFEILEVTRHANKLRTGHLRANRFSITLVGIVEGAAAHAEAIRSELNRAGLINYFGTQRFGYGGRNVEQALNWLRGASHRRRSRFDAKFLPSVLQSDVFNRYLTARCAADLTRLIQGEIVRLQGSKAVFRVDDLEREQPRLTARDVWLTGPMFGPRVVQASDAALALEKQALAELQLADAELEQLSQFAPGARRDLIVEVEDLVVNTETPGQAVLSFTLPSGSYATQLVREFTHEGFTPALGSAEASPDIDSDSE